MVIISNNSVNANVSQTTESSSTIFFTRKSRLKANEFSKHIIEKEQLVSVDTNIFKYLPSEGIYVPLNKQEIQKVIVSYLEGFERETINLHEIMETLHYIYIHTESSEMRESIEGIHVNEINLENKILNIETRTYRDYSPEDYKIQKLDFNSNLLNQQGSPERWLNFLNDILEGRNNKEEVICLLQEFIGSLFIPTAKWEKALLLYGTGANGKGVLLKAISNLLGDNNSVGIGLHEINKSQNLLMLLGKLACFDYDMQQGVQLDSGIIKKLISGEGITGKEVYKRPLSFKPHARLLMATNELPYLKSIDDGISRRFFFIHLKASFRGREDIHLLDKLMEERDQIFARAMEGLKRLLSRKKFKVPEEVKQEINEYIRENDSIELYLEESGWIEVNSNAYVSSGELMISYQKYCEFNGLKPVGLKKMLERLKMKGFYRFNNGSLRGVKGLHIPS